MVQSNIRSDLKLNFQFFLIIIHLRIQVFIRVHPLKYLPILGSQSKYIIKEYKSYITLSVSLKKILIADDHPVFRKGILTILKDEWPTLEVVEAAHGLEIIQHYQTHQPDLLLIDYSMPHLNGFQAAEQLLKKNKDIRIILFTMYDTFEIALNFLKIGGRGFIVKGGENDEVINAIRSVSNGDYYFNSQYEKEIIKCLKKDKSEHVPEIKFEVNELEIVVKLSKGMTSKEIGESMKLSDRTIEYHKSDLLRKTKVKNTAELISYIYKQGIIN